jgi:hypothetical protein
MRWIRALTWTTTAVAVTVLLVVDYRLSHTPERGGSKRAKDFEALLVRTMPAGPNEVFVCPASDAEKWTLGGGNLASTTQSSSAGWRLSDESDLSN